MPSKNAVENDFVFVLIQVTGIVIQSQIKFFTDQSGVIKKQQSNILSHGNLQDEPEKQETQKLYCYYSKKDIQNQKKIAVDQLEDKRQAPAGEKAADV